MLPEFLKLTFVTLSSTLIALAKLSIVPALLKLAVLSNAPDRLMELLAAPLKSIKPPSRLLKFTTFTCNVELSIVPEFAKVTIPFVAPPLVIVVLSIKPVFVKDFTQPFVEIVSLVSPSIVPALLKIVSVVLAFLPLPSWIFSAFAVSAVVKIAFSALLKEFRTLRVPVPLSVNSFVFWNAATFALFAFTFITPALVSV